MNAKKLKYVLLGALTIVACTNSNNENEEVNTGGDGNSTEFVASSGFDWATSRTASISLSSPRTAVVSLYADEECTEPNLLIGNLLVKETVSLDLNIPIHAQAIYAKYASKSGDSKVKEISLSPVTRGEAVAATLPEDVVSPTNEEDAGFRFYHNTGVAMFEDNWPIEPNRDNDFNDVVLEYDLKVTECQNEDLLPGQGYKEGLLLTLDVRAKGGRYPIKLGLVLGGLDKKFIDEVATRIVLKKGQGMEDELAVGTTDVESRSTVFGKSQFCKVTVDLDHGSPVITMDGLSDLGDNQNFFQVKKGYINEGQGMLRAEIKLSGKNRSDLSAAESAAQLKAYRDLITDTKNQNFFIVTNTRKETHMKGYRPTYSYTTYEADSEGLMMDGIPYCAKNGFVWGIKVPVGVAHAYEEVPFAEAYPKFLDWVKSNGAKNQDWYLHPDGEKIVRYW